MAVALLLGWLIERARADAQAAAGLRADAAQREADAERRRRLDLTTQLRRRARELERRADREWRAGGVGVGLVLTALILSLAFVAAEGTPESIAATGGFLAALAAVAIWWNTLTRRRNETVATAVREIRRLAIEVEESDDPKTQAARAAEAQLWIDQATAW